MRCARRHVEIAHRRRIGQHRVDFHPDAVCIEPERVRDPGIAVERIERRTDMQHDLAARIDVGAPCGEQVVNIRLLHLVPAQIDFYGRQQAIKPAGRHAKPHPVYVDAGNSLCLFDRMANREFGQLHVGNASADNALALPLASAKDMQRTAFIHPGNQRGNFGRPDI